MKIFSCDPETIQVKEGLKRLREDLGNIKSLADSISKYGQIQPIVVTRDNGATYLIAGERRLNACKRAEVNVICVLKEDVDDIEMRLLEIEENIKRKSFLPAEEILAIKEVHDTKKKEDSKWNYKLTGDMFNIPEGTIKRKMALAPVIMQFPELKKLTKEVEIAKAASTLAKKSRKYTATKKAVARISSKLDISATDHIFHDNGLDRMRDPELAGTFDVVLTDPPYGVSVHKFQKLTQLKTQITFNDKLNDAALTYLELAELAYKVTKDSGQVLVFLSPNMYEVVRKCFLLFGWLSTDRPIIWVKGSSGQAPEPGKWLPRCYEMIFHFRKGPSRLIEAGLPDWIQEPPIHQAQKVHPSQKPVPLLQALLKRVALPGATVLDPFAGSGSTIIAGLKEKMDVKGFDINEEAYETAVHQITNYLLERNG